jgi:hypothetical protein
MDAQGGATSNNDNVSASTNVFADGEASTRGAPVDGPSSCVPAVYMSIVVHMHAHTPA